MATTEERLARDDKLEALWQAPTTDERPSKPPIARRAASASDSRRLLIGWIGVLTVIYLFEPTPDSAISVPAWGQLLGIAFLGAFIAAVSGLASGRPWALRASMTAAGFGIVLGAACAATGHHAGMWPTYEVLAFGALGAGSWLALKRSA